jgi:catechol 2,3-dioxygenase-like lactoylglutathione lyase family enzyme
VTIVLWERGAEVGPTRRIDGVALWASDLNQSVAFYRDLIGVPLTYSDPHPPEDVPHHEAMWNGDGRLLADLDWSAEGPSDPSLWFNLYQADGPPTTGAQVSIPVDDVDRVHTEAISAGVEVLCEPASGAFGGRRAVLLDPDGNRVEISS